MRFSWTYERRISFWTAVILAVFACVIVAFQLKQDRETKVYALRERLGDYTRMLELSQDYDGLVRIFPEQLRFTVVAQDGDVIFDSEHDSLSNMENHLMRPEIVEALAEGEGTSVRISSTTDCKYFYYARLACDGKIIRVALPYDSSVRHFFRPGNIFILSVFILFVTVVLLLANQSNIFSRNVLRLLKAHIRNSSKGVAVFSSSGRLEYSNALFVQYLNAITGNATDKYSDILNLELFSPLLEFYKNNRDADGENNRSEIIKECGGNVYKIQILVYPEMGFEISLSDITEPQRNAELKQQMASNVAHELRTPVSSIMGYLETLSNFPDMDKGRRRQCIERALGQTRRLSDIIRDLSLITKIEDSSSKLTREKVSLGEVAEEVFGEFASDITAHKITVENKLSTSQVIMANYSLVYAIIRNLVENSIKYAGDCITIHIECYSIVDGFCHFSYYDTGRGVPEEHIGKIFERFYRVNQGRSRESGGSGLGLSIVRNAVRFHGGDIRAVNRSTGGMQVFFSLEDKNI